MDSIEEVLKYKREAEKQIQEVCQRLEKDTGLKVKFIYKGSEEVVLGHNVYNIKIQLDLSQ